jgi:predicted nucleic acid-binding protein
MNARVFVDTNILVYAHVSDDPNKHERASNLLRRSLARTPVIISTQILGEFYSAMMKYKRADDEIRIFIAEIIKRVNVMPVSLPTVELCIKLKMKYGYSYWDSLVLSSALENGCEMLYSEDMQHGQIIEDSVTIHNPLRVL